MLNYLACFPPRLLIPLKAVITPLAANPNAGLTIPIPLAIVSPTAKAVLTPPEFSTLLKELPNISNPALAIDIPFLDIKFLAPCANSLPINLRPALVLLPVKIG
jgi:hypothetical protein